MNKSIKTLELLSEKCSSQTSYYKYNSQNHLSEKYKKGRVDASLWLNNVIYYFLAKEKNFLNEFIQEINSQKNKIKNIKSNEYKQGLCDELDFIKDLVNDNNNK